MKSALALAVAVLAVGAGCAPAVPKDLPKETIAINMNVKIAPEVRAAVEKDLDALFSDEEDLF